MKTMMCTVALLMLALPAIAGSGLTFDHALHVDDVELACEDCHTGVSESVNLLERYRAGKPQCSDCHDLGDTETCGTCHVDGDNPTGHVAGPATVDLFSHASHAGDMDCARCHGAGPAYSGAPVKSDCRTCHQTVANYEDCSFCHSAGRHNVPETHHQDWEANHGVIAGSNNDSCMECHVQDDCQVCHGGDNVRPRVHPLNFEFNHSITARVSATDCAVCHQESSFCEECHSGYGIIPLNHAEPGWTSGSVHGPEALFEIESCISCHDAGEAVPATCAGAGCHEGG